MANKIKIKRSYTPGSSPLTTDLETHECAVNWNDGKLFVKQPDGTIKTITLGGGGGGSLSATVTIPGLGDPHYSNVSLLLHGDGNLTDSSGTPKTVTAAGSAASSATQSKFGGGSLASLASGDTFTVPDSAAFDFAGGDFTVECWVYPVSGNSGFRGIFGKRASAAVQGPLTVYIDPDGILNVLAATASSGGYAASLTASTSPQLNVWSHVAIVRSGSSLAVYVNGASVASSTALGSSSLVANSAAFAVGSTVSDASVGSYWGGYLDEVRVTKGVARTITVPAAAYPNSADLVLPVVFS